MTVDVLAEQREGQPEIPLVQVGSVEDPVNSEADGHLTVHRVLNGHQNG